MEQTTPECEILDLAEKLRTSLDVDTKDILDVFVKCNEVLKRFDKEEIVPVGSSVDDSKVNTPEDFGDVDVLVIAKTINLDESLFEYERDYPSFLRLPGNGAHANYFGENDLVDKHWVKANVLKDLKNSKFFVLTKLFWLFQAFIPVSIIKSTGVGFEFSFFDFIAETITQRNISIDCVPAFSFSGWPRPASEWLHRTRYWPSKEIIGEIVNTGCQIVAKRPLYIYYPGDENRSPEEIETDVIFRLSFSKCELVLSKTMSKSQLMLWRILKAYRKGFLQVTPKVLASYHWKNVVFWISEEENHEFWNPKNLLKAIVKALDFMIDCLKKEFVPFYFVRLENLIAGCRQDMILETLQMVKEIRSQPLDALRQFIQSSPKREKPGNLPLAITYFKECLENKLNVNEENATSEVNIGDLFARLHSFLDPTYHLLQETQRLFIHLFNDIGQMLSDENGLIETFNKVITVIENDFMKTLNNARNEIIYTRTSDPVIDDVSEKDQRSNVEQLNIIFKESCFSLSENDTNTCITWILGWIDFVKHGYGDSFSEENCMKHTKALCDIFKIPFLLWNRDE